MVIIPKVPTEAKTLDFYHELKSALIGQCSLTIKGYFRGKCYDSAGLVGNISIILDIATFSFQSHDFTPL